MSETVQCAFAHCYHDSRDLLRESGVQYGKRWMHTDCAHCAETMAKIRDLYYEKVDKLVVFAQLTRVINNIIFVKQVSPDYLLFALDYATKNNIKIKAPFGLHYIIGYDTIELAWKQKELNRKREETKKALLQAKPVETEEHRFVFHGTKASSFADILKGK